MSDPYVAAIESMRRSKDNAFARDPRSPIDDKDAFKGLACFPIDTALRIRTRSLRHAQPATLPMQTSDGQARESRNVGQFEVEVAGERMRLQAYRQRGAESSFAQRERAPARGP
ncbi:MAG TPA: DUF1684 domain-containing protein [Candidatus Thermoplasmatota archaeon]|nr:DUF1684 domain-containing protein [Candidatus Thermoplasmatota archaeon]